MITKVHIVRRRDEILALVKQDILDAIKVVERYLPPDRDSFDRDPLLQSHIFRHLMIIGEAWVEQGLGL